MNKISGLNAMHITDNEYKECLSHFSTGIAIATTSTRDNELVGITINSFTSVSLNPKLILFCVDKKSTSLENFIKSDSFAICILGAEQYLVAKQFATPGIEKWSNIKYVLGATKSPIIIPNIAFMECDKYASYEAGDHFIIVGQVINLEVERNLDPDPLIYFRGKYFHQPEPV